MTLYSRSTTVRLQGQQGNSSVEDTYQSVVNEHIYHTLEPQNEHSTVVDGTVYDSLCKLDVMLPNGQMVPATLVRNVHGRVIPLVEVNSRTLPHENQPNNSLGPVSYNKILMQNSPPPQNISNHRSSATTNQRHFVWQTNENWKMTEKTNIRRKNNYLILLRLWIQLLVPNYNYLHYYCKLYQH